MKEAHYCKDFGEWIEEGELKYKCIVLIEGGTCSNCQNLRIIKLKGGS